MSENNLKAVIEALLFASEKPLTLEKIKNVLDTLEVGQIRGLVEELKSEYEKSERGLRVVEVAGGFQIITAPGFAPFLKRFFKERFTEKLSKPALQTLAIIAYKQPLTKLEIELLRNVNIDGVMKNLLDKDLIRVAGRKKTPGRPIVYGTTRKFLEYFGLKSLEELPKMEEFSKLAINSEQVDIEVENEEAAPATSQEGKEQNEPKESSKAN